MNKNKQTNNNWIDKTFLSPTKNLLPILKKHSKPKYNMFKHRIYNFKLRFYLRKKGFSPPPFRYIINRCMNNKINIFVKQIIIKYNHNRSNLMLKWVIDKLNHIILSKYNTLKRFRINNKYSAVCCIIKNTNPNDINIIKHATNNINIKKYVVMSSIIKHAHNLPKYNILIIK